eukprot:CAMPEP_0119556308 /NCGR_PEP_ID=MMETSP1352-20130426/8308_1 /TAXON_ID=265584 /ORGANISM="Stauroneis constricta, Strain CCMP1120" /LENGTH=603 /DNA_ID=CAMNT_0007603251 /DNA_START=339 /DNA_END=2150 /DNA_ORIENTATION=+
MKVSAFTIAILLSTLAPRINATLPPTHHHKDEAAIADSNGASLLRGTAHALDGNAKNRRLPSSTASSHKKRMNANDDEDGNNSSKPIVSGAIETGKATNGNFETNIVGGSEATRGEYPEYVNLEIGCGGSLITRDIVLTAAHCDSNDGIGLKALVGAFDKFADEQTGPNDILRTIVEKVPYPGYASSEVDDVMVMKLSAPVPENYPVIKLNGATSKPANGQTMTVIGMGDTTHNGFASDQLLEVDVQKIATNACNGGNQYNGIVNNDAEFCAGRLQNGQHQGGKDACEGDSGGPIFMMEGGERLQVGVVSWGYGCGDRRYPGVYARVSNTFEWIKTTACDMSDVPSALCGDADDGNTGGGDGGNDSGNGNGNGCDSDEVMLDVQINTDKYGHETSWILSNADSNRVIAEVEAGNYRNKKSYKTKQCLPSNECFNIKISDTFGDGMRFAKGGYEVSLGGKLVTKKDRPNFGDSVDIPFCGPDADGGGNDDNNGTGGDDNDDDCIEVQLDLRTDDYPEETSFMLYDASDDTVEYWMELNFPKANHNYGPYKACVPKNRCTHFDFYDDFGDGIEGRGFTLQVDGKEVHSGGNFGNDVFKSIPAGCD